MKKEEAVELGARAIREKLVRQGFFNPRQKPMKIRLMEERQREEGPVPDSELDCFKD